MYDSKIGRLKSFRKILDFKHYSKTSYISKKDSFFFDWTNLNSKAESENSIDLVSENKKFLVEVSNAYYPFLFQGLYQIIAFYSLVKNRNVELYIVEINKDKHLIKNRSLINFLKKYLDDMGIRYYFINDDVDLIKINNFYLISGGEFAIGSEFIYSKLSKYLINKSLKPSKKVFVSRKQRAIDGEQEDNIAVTRIDKQQEIEDFFKDMGFEVVYPENFSSFIDQINYFYEVSVMVSVSSSGLCNAVFMQPGTTVIEISTLFDFTPEITEIHDFYRTISLFKKQNYLSISNISTRFDDLKKNTSAIELIRQIAKNS